MVGSAIVGTGYHLPARVVGTEELAYGLGVSPEWILSRTGIRSRHLAADDESVADLAEAAARSALVDAGVTAGAVGAVVVATSTGERMPSTASQVAGRLGIGGAAFDVNAACAGFCHAVTVADGLIRAGHVESVLVIGADRASTAIDWTDRNTAPLFGDGAGAVVLRRSGTAGVAPVVWGTLGGHGDLVRLSDRTLRQAGPAVFRWAIGLGGVVRDICVHSGVDPGRVAAFVPHQANLRIVDALAEVFPAQTVVARDVVDVGNTMAASIPIALARLAARGVPAGAPVVLFGFGSGLSYAGQVVRLAPDRAITPPAPARRDPSVVIGV